MKTTIHAYHFNVENPDEAEQYRAMCNTLRDAGHGKPLVFAETDRGAFHRKHILPLDGQEIELDDTHLFPNQWNTKATATSDKGLRVFDWTEAYFQNERIKRGHYLAITPEMKAARDNRHVCGFCGHQAEAQRGGVFCSQCLDSQFLDDDDLHLLRMLPASLHLPKRKPLTDAERAHLMPLYVEAQKAGKGERATKERAALIKTHEANKRKADIELQGKLWLLDNGFQLGNVIYYSHKDRWCFGWREAMGGGELARLLDAITEFPFSYDIECDDGRTLSGER